MCCAAWCQETATRGAIVAVAGMHMASGDNMTSGIKSNLVHAINHV